MEDSQVAVNTWRVNLLRIGNYSKLNQRIMVNRFAGSL
jgi:hypothetical protein